MFPEGTRRNTGEIHAFKKGAFHVAIAAQIPILPIVYSQYYFMDEQEKKFDSGEFVLRMKLQHISERAGPNLYTWSIQYHIF